MYSSILALLMQPLTADAVLPVRTAPATAEAALPDGAQLTADADDPRGESQALPAIILPKGHQILIMVDAEVGSKISSAGQTFPITLAQAVVIDGIEVLPAGIVGGGEVVHAKKGGLAGSAGELVLAARYLDFAGRRIALRSFKFAEEGDEIMSRGKDNVGIASATNAVIGPLGFLIGGGNTTIAPGTVATAKIRDDEAFDRAAEAPGVQDESQ